MTDIVTLTVNPALDLAAEVDRLEPRHKLRCEHPVWHPGGGGINVARVLHRLGHEVRAVFPTGGSTGERVCRLLADEGVPASCLPIAQETRESFHIIERSTGDEYRFVLPGPTIEEEHVRGLLARVADALPSCLIASGSLAPGLPDNFLADLARWAQKRQIDFAVDSSGPALRMALEAGVWLVKPSLRELQQLTGLSLPDRASQVQAARQLVERHQARIVALSLGPDGAMLITPQGGWWAPSIPVPVVGTVGAGDSFLAGLVSGLRRGDDPEQALRRALAAAAAALMAPGTMLCQAERIEPLMAKAQVHRLPA